MRPRRRRPRTTSWPRRRRTVRTTSTRGAEPHRNAVRDGDRPGGRRPADDRHDRHDLLGGPAHDCPAHDRRRCWGPEPRLPAHSTQRGPRRTRPYRSTTRRRCPSLGVLAWAWRRPPVHRPRPPSSRSDRSGFPSSPAHSASCQAQWRWWPVRRALCARGLTAPGCLPYVPLPPRADSARMSPPTRTRWDPPQADSNGVGRCARNERGKTTLDAVRRSSVAVNRRGRVPPDKRHHSASSARRVKSSIRAPSLCRPSTRALAFAC